MSPWQPANHTFGLQAAMDSGHDGGGSILDSFFNGDTGSGGTTATTGLDSVWGLLGVIFGVEGLLFLMLVIVFWGLNRGMTALTQLAVKSLNEPMGWTIFPSAMVMQLIMLFILVIFIVRVFMDFVNVSNNMLIGIIPVGVLGYTNSIASLLADVTASVLLLFVGPREGDHVHFSDPRLSGIVLRRTLVGLIVFPVQLENWKGNHMSQKAYRESFSDLYEQYHQGTVAHYIMIRNNNVLSLQPTYTPRPKNA